MSATRGVCLLLLSSFLVAALPCGAAELAAPVERWLNTQTNLQTWSADVTQVRSIKTLTQPLTAHGHVWFQAPNRFRWEIGQPPSTIALRQKDQMLVIYPRLKRAERYPLGGEAGGRWKDTLALLETGFPRSKAELESKFQVVGQSGSDDSFTVMLQPKSASARKMMPELKITFSTKDYTLLATQLQFADGSTMRTEFSAPRVNPKLEPDLFEPRLGDDIKLVEPLK